MGARTSRTTSFLKHHPLLVFLAVGYVLVPPAISAQPPLQLDVVGGFTSQHILVRFKPELVQQPAGKAPVGVRNAPSRTRVNLTPEMNRLSAEWRVTSIRPAYPYEFANPQLAAQLGLDRTFVVEVPQGTRTPEMVRAYRQQGDTVEVAELDVIGGIAGVPNDVEFGKQWGMHNTGQSICANPFDPGDCTNGILDCDIDAPEAWDLHTGGLGTVTIAIIDSGISSHGEFGNRVLPGTNTNDPMNNPNLTTDPVNHGTHVAGIAAASGNNGSGVAGVTWGANILPVRVTNDMGRGQAIHAANGLIWAVDNGADICNMSLQYYYFSEQIEPLENFVYFENAVNYAYAQGAVLVAAAGNQPNGGGTVAAPARFAPCMAVTAINNVCDLANVSNSGDEVDVCAPGDAVYSTSLTTSYRYLTGTSMAAPHVSGLAALVKSYAPALTNQQIREIIEDTTDDLGPAGWDSEFGTGRINAHAALLAAGPNDGNPCTDEIYDPILGWIAVPVAAGTPCGNQTPVGPCDASDVCDGNGMCIQNLLPHTMECRPAAGDCDVSELCTGASPSCPPNMLAPGTQECRASAGPCDPAELCDGSSANCSPDLFSTAVCRPAVDVCDLVEGCTGSGPDCPPDAFAPSETQCGDDGNECTNDVCDGSGVCTHPLSGQCGACCLADKDCIEDVLAATCEAQGGNHQGAGSVCAGDGIDDLCDNCPGVDDGIFGVRICSASGSPCQSTVDCPQGQVCKKACIDEIPTVSQWGLVIIALLLLAGGKVYFGRSPSLT